MIKITIIDDDTLKTIDEYEAEKLRLIRQPLEEEYEITHTEKLEGQYAKYWVKRK